MQNKKTYQIFMEVCGDLPVGAHKRPGLAKTLDLLRALPDNYSKAKRWRGLALREIAEQSKGSDSRLAVKTLKRHFAAIGSHDTWRSRRPSKGGLARAGRSHRC